MTAIDLQTSPQRPVSWFNPLSLRQFWLSIDKNDRAIEWAQSRIGVAVLHTVFLLCIAAIPLVRTKHMALIAVTLTLMAFLPERRTMVLAAMGIVFFLLRPFRNELHYTHFGGVWSDLGLVTANAQVGLIVCSVMFLGLILLLVENQRRKSVSIIAERPVLGLFILGTALTGVTLGLGREHLLFAPAWLFVAYLSSTFFFLGYILMAVRQKGQFGNATLLGYVRPFWADSVVPIKGPGYLSKFEARDANDLALSRLKGVKLVVWALVLFWVAEIVFNRFLHQGLGLPQFAAHLKAVAASGSVSLSLNWAVLTVYFLERILFVGALVHALVAVIRMAGFCIPRGMVRPLASRTIAEYWGRYLFYFKELLSDFFFFPTFQRYFRKHPRLRIAFATFMAAFVGNILFDVISEAPAFGVYGFAATIDNFYSYTVYAGGLTLGIIWSQLFQAKPRAEDGFFRYEVMPRVIVLGFFGLLQVFDDSSGVIPLSDRFIFFVSLFGVN